MTHALALALAWGTVGEWVGGLATAGGLIFAGLEIRMSMRQREAEEQRRREDEDKQRKAMARAVSINAYYEEDDDYVVRQGSWASDEIKDVPWMKMEYTVHNGGEFPIHNVVVVVVDPGAEAEPEEQRGCAKEIVIGTLAAKETVQDQSAVRFTEEPVFGELTALAGVLFTDVWGNHWYSGGGRLVERDSPPRIC